MLVSQHLERGLNNDNENIIQLRIQWHPLKDLLGVANVISSQGGFVSFFTKRGGKPIYTSTLKEGLQPKLITWHGKLPLLAVGWSTGSISLIDPIKRLENTFSQVNFSEVRCLVWSDEDSTLLAIDTTCRIRSFKHIVRQGVNELTLFHETCISDELPSCVLVNPLNQDIFGKTSAEASKNAIGVSSDTNANENDTLTKLLNKHRKFMDFENHKSIQPNNSMAKKYSVAFIATQKGTLYAYDANGGVDAIRIFQADSEIFQMLRIPEQFYILLITKGMMFYQLSIHGRHATDRIKVKLAGRPENFAMIHTTAETIAFCYGEAEVRIWDLRNEDSAILTLNMDKGYESTDRIVALSYSTKKACISGFTEDGKLINWRNQQQPSTKKFDAAILNNWRLQNSIQLTGAKILQAVWSPISASLAISTEKSVELFVSQGFSFFVSSEYAVVQINPQMLTLIRIVDPSESVDLKLHTNIKGFFLTNNYLLIWDNAKIQLDQIIYTNDFPLSIQSISSFELGSEVISKGVYHNNRILLIEKDRINIKTIQGTLKKSIKFRDAEGVPILLDLNVNWLCVATSNAYLFIYDMNDE